MFIKLFYIFFITLLWFVFAGLEGTLTYPILSFISLALILASIIKLKLLPKNLYHPIGLISYIFWLIREVIISSLDVMKIIWSPKSNIKPTIVELSTSFDADSPELAIYANSITLTPGTLSVDIIGAKIIVHCLNTKFLRDLASGSMQKRLKKALL